MKKIDLSLYAITDEHLLKKDIEKAVEQAIKGGATVVQYRAKNKETKDMYEEALKIKKICDRYSIPFIINDRIDIALAVDATGVHIGQEDIPVEVARRLLGTNKIIGLSTKNLKQVKEANKLPVDYIGFGSIFSTKTKEDVKIAGLEALKKALTLSIQPVVAIGGINHQNIDKVLQTGCKNIAVVSAIFKDKKNITQNTKSLYEKIKKGKTMGFQV
ncbi:MAG: thiamine phosphate synthase [Aquificae bacterium]|nr:thiamine phosphate synthase [Aquificota bacterium]